MNLFDAPPRSDYDWNFRLGDVPVRVHWYFWITPVAFSLGNLNQPFVDILTNLAIWIAVLLVSLLVHEMGHVLMGRRYGADGHIVLTGLCGLAIGSSDLPERRQRIAVSLAGPGAGFLFAALIVVILFIWNGDLALTYLANLVGIQRFVQESTPIPPRPVSFAIVNLLFFNIIWGLVNLLPVWPLDGGKVSRELCQQYRERDGVRLSLQISLGVSVCVAVLGLVSYVAKFSVIPFLQLDQSLLPTFFFGVFAYMSYQMLQMLKHMGPGGEAFEEEEQSRAPWEQDADWWKSGRSPWRD